MKDILQTICQGALGGLTFGAYHHYVTMKAIELHNEKLIEQQKQSMDMEKRHKEFKTEETINK